MHANLQYYFLVECKVYFSIKQSKNRSQQTAGTCMMHLCVNVISIIAPARAIFLLIGANFPSCSARSQTMGSQPLCHFYHARLVFSAVHLLKSWNFQGAGERRRRWLELQSAATDPTIKRDTRNSIHMHYVHFSCSLVVAYSTFVCTLSAPWFTRVLGR